MTSQNAQNKFKNLALTLSWQRSLSYSKQSIDLLCKSVDWFLYDIDLRYERVNARFLKLLTFKGLTLIFLRWLGIDWLNYSLQHVAPLFPTFLQALKNVLETSFAMPFNMVGRSLRAALSHFMKLLSFDTPWKHQKILISDIKKRTS